MEKGIGIFFRDFLAAVQAAKLYSIEHPLLKNAAAKAFNSLTLILNEQPSFTIGIIGNEIASGKDILFSLSKLSESGLAYFKDRDIEKVTFKRGVDTSELIKFIQLLTMPKEDIKINPQDQLLKMGVDNIILGRLGIEEPKNDNAAKAYFEDISFPLNSVLNLEAVNGLALKASLNNIINNLGQRYQELLKLNTLKRYDLGTFTHLINTSILSMYFASRIGFAKEVILEIGLSALFHDIGKLYISRKVIRKPGQLNEVEFSLMESHTTLGSILALRYVDTLGIMPVVVSFEHHLKYDLSGYPKLAFPRKPNIASQIVSICDVYDALSGRRSYKADYPPDVIYKLMMRGKGVAYNPDLLDKFFQVVGVWPIGSIVGLSDKKVALVVAENQDDIFSPQVKVIYPQKEEQVIDLKGKKGSLKIERYLNPLKEGKEFLIHLQT